MLLEEVVAVVVVAAVAFLFMPVMVAFRVAADGNSLGVQPPSDDIVCAHTLTTYTKTTTLLRVEGFPGVFETCTAGCCKGGRRQTENEAWAERTAIPVYLPACRLSAGAPAEFGRSVNMRWN